MLRACENYVFSTSFPTVDNFPSRSEKWLRDGKLSTVGNDEFSSYREVISQFGFISHSYFHIYQAIPSIQVSSQFQIISLRQIVRSHHVRQFLIVKPNFPIFKSSLAHARCYQKASLKHLSIMHCASK